MSSTTPGTPAAKNLAERVYWWPYYARGGAGCRHHLQQGRPPALPTEGSRLPGRVRADAGRGAVSSRTALDRARDRAQPNRPRRRPGDGQHVGARGDREPELSDG